MWMSAQIVASMHRYTRTRCRDCVKRAIKATSRTTDKNGARQHEPSEYGPCLGDYGNTTTGGVVDSCTSRERNGAMIVELTGEYENHGSVTLLGSVDDDGTERWFGGDARVAHDLIDAVLNGDEAVMVAVDDWQWVG